MRLNYPPLSLLQLLTVLPYYAAVVSGENATTDADDCNCANCPESDRVFLGTHKDFVSPACPEGSVGTVTALRSIDDHGDYKVVTWNPGSYSEEVSVTGTSYVYRQASMDEETSCFTVDPDVLPVVGDQPEIKVTLNCEALTYCDFRWDVEFGCAETGVVDSTNGGLRVLSDVDDTIKCSNPSTTCDSVASCTAEGTISAYLAGKDRRLEHGEMYPGVAELMLGLALGPTDGNGGLYYPSKPSMLSARPREAEFALGIDQDSNLNVYFEAIGDRYEHGSWGVNVDGSFYGTIFDGKDFTEFGETKAKHYNSVSAENPTTRFAFVADNGQGDLCAAQSMLESSAGDRVVAVLMQVVVDPADETTECEDPETGDFTLDLPEGERVHYFRTYSDAALWSYEKGIISCCSASNVHYAVDEWYECRCSGNCPASGQLPTGGSERATRNETLAYCEELKADQVLLGEAVATCDRSCATPGEYVPPSATGDASAAQGRFVSGVGAGVVLATVFGFLLP